MNWRRKKFKIVAYLSHLLKSNNAILYSLGDEIKKLMIVQTDPKFITMHSYLTIYNLSQVETVRPGKEHWMEYAFLPTWARKQAVNNNRQISN